jgi:HEAT repeat protein
MIFLFFLLSQAIDFEDLFNKATTALVKFQAEQDSAFNMLVQLGQDSLWADTTINFLVSKFDTKTALERHRLKDIFKKIGVPAIKGIVRQLDYRGSDEEARSLKQSLWVLGEIGGLEIVEPVSCFIEDDQWSIRSNAYTALGKSKLKTALSFIIQGLNDSISMVRKSAYYALGQVATEKEIPYLINGLDDEFYGVRYACMKGLVNIGEPVIDPLLQLLGQNKVVDYFIFRVLSEIYQENLDQYVKNQDPSIRLLIYEAVGDTTTLKNFYNAEDNLLLKNYLIKQYPHPLDTLKQGKY